MLPKRRVTIMLSDEITKKVKKVQAHLIQTTVKSISFSFVMDDLLQQSLKKSSLAHKIKSIIEKEDTNPKRRITITLSEDVTKKVKKVQAELITISDTSVSFSFVVNKLLQQVLKKPSK